MVNGDIKGERKAVSLKDREGRMEKTGRVGEVERLRVEGKRREGEGGREELREG